MSAVGERDEEKGWRLRARLRALYHGSSLTAVRYRLAVLVVDFAIIAFFIASPLLKDQLTPLAFYAIDYLCAALLAFDLIARGYAYCDWRGWFRRPMVWLDIFVLATLLLPAWLFNLGFLRILRLYTLLNSEFFWRTIGRRYDDTRVEEIVRALAALLTFVFIATGFVYATFAGQHDNIHGYVDALYFTITTLTTTGFGDITLPGTWGRLLTIAIMLLGVSMFIRLASALFRPHKVRFPCPVCGLQRHDPDAVHCKACGELLNIPDEGD